MSELSYTKLDDTALAAAVATLKGWAVVDGALTKSYAFETYKDGLIFAAGVGYAAERLNHHPDIHIGYRKATISMVTHDADGGITPYDIELARRIDRLGL